MRKEPSLAVVALLAVLAATCSKKPSPTTPTTTGSTPSPTPVPTTAPTFDVNGSWSGSAAGATFNFSISGGSQWLFGLRQIPGCGSTIFGWTATVQVAANAFTYNLPASHPDLSGQISGRFTSANAASGNLNITFKTACGRSTLSGSWSASK